MNLAKFVQILELKYPKLFAASWDNVGLLVNPPNVHVKNILLTNDFTKAVLHEAKSKNCNLIISYHPVIFKGIKALDIEAQNKDALCLDAFFNNIAIYCPHTILDRVSDGVNDWLISRFGSQETSIITPVKNFDEFSKYFQSVVSVDVMQPLDKLCLHNQSNFYVFSSNNRSYIFNDQTWVDEQWVNFFGAVDSESIAERYQQFCWGDGRMIEMQDALSIVECVEILKKHLRVPYVMLASPAQSILIEKNIKRIAACAGSGGSILRGANANLVITGELDHHSVLEFLERGIHVILTNHSNSERGFLETYMHQINNHLACFTIPPNEFPHISISQEDRDPLTFV